MVVGFVTCGPNEAIVVSGCCHSEPLMVQGGMAFVWPFLQRVQRISLNTMTLVVDSPKVYSREGVAISVTGIAQVKIDGQHQELLKAACQQFLGKKEKQIRKIAMETVEGYQRAIMGNMTVEELAKDRKKFATTVFQVATTDLVNMGLIVVSYTLKDIRDDEGYLMALGMARTAEVKRDAKIGECEARRDAMIRGAVAEERQMTARFHNDIAIAGAHKDYELKKASFDMEVNTKKAEAELAFHLQSAKTKQKIKEEEMNIKVVERTQAILLEEQEITRREMELHVTVKQPADAERYRLERISEATKHSMILEAEAEAEAIKVRGEATAFAIEAKAKADAEQMNKKAIAWQEYHDAAMVDMILETTPKIVAEVTRPLCQTNKIVMVSSGNGEIGAAKMAKEILDIVAKVPEVVKALTNVDIAKSMKLASTAV